jgi:lipopolysaccharide transport system permease protein
MAFALGAGLIVAAATTKYRDLAFVIAFAVQLFMYMSPVIFPLAKVQQGSTVRMVVEANPLTPVIEGFRGALLGTYVDWGTLWYPACSGRRAHRSRCGALQRLNALMPTWSDGAA